MRYDEIENIWTVDLRALSNADRGKVFFERAKQIVGKSLASPSTHAEAFRHGRYSRSYLVERIGAQPAVTTQNPGIKDLLRKADERLSGGLTAAVRDDSRVPSVRPTPGARSAREAELQSVVDDLRRVNEVQAAELDDLRRIVRENEWIVTGLADHGALPW